MKERMRLIPSATKSEHGQSLTELAISLTLLFIILAGIVDLGRAFFTYISLRDAAQEGALYGSYNPDDCAGVIQRARETTKSAGGGTKGPVDLLNDPNVSVSCSVTKACVGGTVVVSTEYQDFPITMPFLGTIIGRQTMDITASIKDEVLVPVVCPSP